MKSQLKRVAMASAGVFLLLSSSGCYESNAEGEVPVTPAPRASAVGPVAANVPRDPEVVPVVLAEPAKEMSAEPFKDMPGAAEAEPEKAAPAVATSTNTLSTNVVKVVQPVRPPENLKASPVVQEVIKLAEAGVGEDVLMAYITNSTRAYQLSSDEIVYLNDLGVSSEVITAMLQKNGGEEAPAMVPAPATNAAPAVAAAPPVAPPAPVAATSAGLPPAVTEVPADQAATAVAPPQQPVSTTTFYSSLSPYGTWMEVPEYGMVWQPTVVTVNAGWRPYSDRGRWMWTDQGWYWYSDYSWGWAPFHYGRWCTYPRLGWVWVPDTVWGPSWVSWRYTTSHCGWAPLPPLAHYRSGFGFTYHSRSVGISFDFGLAPDCYTFVPTHRFHHRHPRQYAVPPRQTTTIYNNSVVVNNYVRGNNNTIINRGFGKEPVVRATGTELQTVHVRQATAAPLAGRGEHLSNNGGTIVAAKPALQQHAAMRNSLQATRAAAFTPAPAAPVKPQAPGERRPNDFTPIRNGGRVQPSNLAKAEPPSAPRMPGGQSPTSGNLDKPAPVVPANQNVRSGSIFNPSVGGNPQPRPSLNNNRQEKPAPANPSIARRIPETKPATPAPATRAPATPAPNAVQANPFGHPTVNTPRNESTPGSGGIQGSPARPLNRPVFSGRAGNSAATPSTSTSVPNNSVVARNNPAPTETVRSSPFNRIPSVPASRPSSPPTAATRPAPPARTEVPASRPTFTPSAPAAAPTVRSSPFSVPAPRSNPTPPPSAPAPVRSFSAPPPTRSAPPPASAPVRQAPSGRRGQDN